MKHLTKVLALAIMFCMLLSIGVVSFAASGEPSGEPSGEVATGTESIETMHAAEYSSNNSFNRDDSGYIYIGYDIVNGALTANSNWSGATATEVVLDNEVEGAGFTAVRAAGDGSEVTVTGTLVLTDDTAGEHASDFSGVGAAFNAYNGAVMTIADVDLTTDGFVRAGLVVDQNAIAVIKDSSFVTYGANPLTEAWEGYYNSANTGMMLSPPWVLGIQGGIRTINVLNNTATLVIENTYLASGGWGVISTDGCTQPVIYVIDSDLEILAESEGGMNSGWAIFGYDEDAYGSGYGAYIIGKTTEENYGVHVDGATFAAICREGSISYASSSGEIAMTAATGEDLGTYTGSGRVSEINTVFGVMTHSSENVSVTVADGTIVNTEKAIFLYRTSGVAEFTVDNAVLNSGNGIILQMIDDDDSTVGGFSPFNSYLYEESGLPSENGEATGESSSREMVILTLTNGEYTGDVYNGTGYYTQGNDVLNVTVGAGATLNGDIALTETIHGLPYTAEAAAALDQIDDVEYELMDADFNIIETGASGEMGAEPAYIHITQFSINEYYLLCNLIDHIYYNGYSLAQVTVSGGVWNVAEESLVTYLKIDGGCVFGEVTDNGDGTYTITPSDRGLTEGEWGEFVEVEIEEAEGMGNASTFDDGDASDEMASGEMASGEMASAEPAADAAATSAGASWADYQEYLIEAAGGNAPDLDEFKSQVYSFSDWDSIPQSESPWDQLFSTVGVSTWEEFQQGSLKTSVVEGSMG